VNNKHFLKIPNYSFCMQTNVLKVLQQIGRGFQFQILGNANTDNLLVHTQSLKLTRLIWMSVQVWLVFGCTIYIFQKLYNLVFIGDNWEQCHSKQTHNSLLKSKELMFQFFGLRNYFSSQYIFLSFQVWHLAQLFFLSYTSLVL
jgi:hypothetical protein